MNVVNANDILQFELKSRKKNYCSRCVQLKRKSFFSQESEFLLLYHFFFLLASFYKMRDKEDFLFIFELREKSGNGEARKKKYKESQQPLFIVWNYFNSVWEF